MSVLAKELASAGAAPHRSYHFGMGGCQASRVVEVIRDDYASSVILRAYPRSICDDWACITKDLSPPSF
jgi:hypothetical protein